MYFVKSRNWNNSRLVGRVFALLPLSTDGERYWYQSASKARAWALWAVLMAFRTLSGGWTYITYPGAAADGRYLSIYRRAA